MLCSSRRFPSISSRSRIDSSRNSSMRSGYDKEEYLDGARGRPARTSLDGDGRPFCRFDGQAGTRHLGARDLHRLERAITPSAASAGMKPPRTPGSGTSRCRRSITGREHRSPRSFRRTSSRAAISAGNEPEAVGTRQSMRSVQQLRHGRQRSGVVLEHERREPVDSRRRLERPGLHVQRALRAASAR